MSLSRVHVETRDKTKLACNDARAAERGMALLVYREGSLIARIDLLKIDSRWVDEAC